MDEALSRLMPIHRIGDDGFPWWIGQIEGTYDDDTVNKGGYRYKVRIVGDHPGSKEILPTAALPWATVMMPVNVPFMPGNIAGACSQLIEGCYVVGFYIDSDKQKPIILGSIGQTPGATKIVYTPGPQRSPFIPGANANFPTDVYKDGVEEVTTVTDGESGISEDGARTGSGLSTGREVEVDGKKKEDIPVPPSAKERIKREEWCQEVAERCNDVDLKTKMTTIVGQMLADIQNNGGNIGDYYTNKISGRVNSAISTGRVYVNKAIRVVREFLAKIKGYIKKLLSDAINNLVKALLAPDDKGNRLTPVTEFFNNALKNLGCQMADLGERLISWLTNVMMSYISQVYRSTVCHIDEFVNGIISKINQLLNEILGSVLGPLQDILGAIAEPLNVIGKAINYVLKLLGISCTGPDQTCSKYKKVCVSGETEGKKDDEDFLDGLLSNIDNLFGNTPGDYTQYTCEDAYTGKPLSFTTVGFTGGVPLPYKPKGPNDTSTKRPKITYNINDITVTRGDVAIFTITRSGYLEEASSVAFKTLDTQGTATAGEDYFTTNAIVGFQPEETEKTVEIRTLGDPLANRAKEEFFVRITKNSPIDSSGISSVFTVNLAKCTIQPIPLKEEGSPNIPAQEDPEQIVLPEDTPTFPFDGEGNPTTEPPSTTDASPSYEVVANRSVCPEDEFIVYSITTSNVVNGTILYYTLFGKDITPDDIIGGSLNGSFVISNNKAQVTVGIAEDGVVEEAETLTFAITGKGATADVIITSKDDLDLPDFDEGVGDSPETVFDDFKPPTVNIPDVITDDNGGIIEIPVDKPGDAWAEPPYVWIGGEGVGATATGLLDENGFLTEIRVLSPGFGYKINRSDDNDKRCIIDTFTVTKFGVGYQTKPEIYINDEPGLAEAIINDAGFLIGARMLDRTKTFEGFPEIKIVGGGGYGAQLLPSLVCLDTDGLSKIGSTKIGTGRYVDCP